MSEPIEHTDQPFPVREALCFAVYGVMAAADCLGLLPLPPIVCWLAYTVFLLAAGATLHGIGRWRNLNIPPTNSAYRDIRHTL